MIYGIYIISGPGGKVYVGQATRGFDQRCEHHKKRLNKGTHANRYLQSAWNKHGPKAFKFILIEVIDGGASPNHFTVREQHWMDKLSPLGLYNIVPASRSALGIKRSAETKQRIGKASLGRTFSIESKQRMSAMRKGSKRSQSTKDKHRNAYYSRSDTFTSHTGRSIPVKIKDATGKVLTFASQKEFGVACGFGNPAAAVRNALARGNSFETIARRRGLIK